MEIEIKKEKETPLLSRKRITATTYVEGPTPSRSNIMVALAKAAKAKPELVCVKHIYTHFGTNEVKIIAHIYDDRKTMETLENKKLLEKHVMPEPEKKEEAPAAEATEETTEETPAEEEKKEE